MRTQASAKGVLTVTGILGSPLPCAGADPDELDAVADSPRQVEEVISHLFTYTRYLLTLKGRPPFN